MISAMALPAKVLEFRTYVKHLELGGDALRELREQKLRSLVAHAWSRVPYYRSLFDAAGLEPASIRTLEDLTKIPITTKVDLRAAGLERTLARGTDPHACFKFATSGSTGKPFEVFLSRREESTQLMIRLRAQWAAGLFKPRERVVVLGPVHWRPLPLYQRLGFFRREYLSPRLPVDEQIERLERLRPSVLWIYPSLLAGIFERLDGRLSAVIQPRAIITSSEVVPRSLRQAISTDLDAEWFNFYGTVEAGRIAWECHTHLGLHLSADAFILETIGGPGEPARAVVTVLDARTMPFIRYDLGDLCAYLERPCSCGIQFPLLEAPRGRVGGLVRLPDGRTLGPSVLNSILRECQWIDQFQIRQEELVRVTVHIVPLEQVPEGALADLRGGLLQQLGNSIRLEIVVGRSLPPGPKRGYFVSGL